MNSEFLFHEIFLRHAMGPGHPEQPARLTAALDACRANLQNLAISEPRAASHSALIRAHSERHVQALYAAAPVSGSVQIDPDTAMNSASLDAARVAAGAVIKAAQDVASGTAQNAFCCVRPPGHHAERERAMGFCLFNNVAVGVYHALDNLGLERIAILDFDVHHGNGTEDIFRDDDRVLFCSSYQHPYYPNVNTPSVPGRLINVPLPAGTGGATFRRAIEANWLPAVRAFAPQMIFVSAGFDAHADDPLAQFELVDDDFAWLATMLLTLADELCGGRLVATLEGGYDLDALGRCVSLFVARLHEATA